MTASSCERNVIFLILELIGPKKWISEETLKTGCGSYIRPKYQSVPCLKRSKASQESETSIVDGLYEPLWPTLPGFFLDACVDLD